MNYSTAMNEFIIVKKQAELPDQWWTLGLSLEQIGEFFMVCHPLCPFD